MTASNEGECLSVISVWNFGFVWCLMLVIWCFLARSIQLKRGPYEPPLVFQGTTSGKPNRRSSMARITVATRIAQNAKISMTV
jgi:hypothetical protein